MKSLSLSAVGDCLITRHLAGADEPFMQLKSLIQKAEVRFANLEVTVHNGEGIPGACSGGTWAMTTPDILDDLAAYGFNMMATANNHALDYSEGGMLATIRHLDERGIVHAGTGKDLAQASAPQYLDCPSGRVALIAVTVTAPPSWIAGEQRRDAAGRPGVNPLRLKTVYQVSPEQMQQLRQIALDTNINAYSELMIEEGFRKAVPEGEFAFGDMFFQISDLAGVRITPKEQDARRIFAAITEAERQADTVLISIHSHEMEKRDKSMPAEFFRQFARQCLDAGAHAVIGHGPHVLRGIEIYKERPIFYSLGNFIFQSDTVRSLPADFYDQYDLGPQHNVADALDARCRRGTRGLAGNSDVWESVVPFWTMKDGKLETMAVHPIELGCGLPRYQSGWPVRSRKTAILEKLSALSEPFQTRFRIDEMNGIASLV